MAMPRRNKDGTFRKSPRRAAAKGRKNPAATVVYRGETIHHDGPAYLVPGIRWGDGTGAVPRFLTLAGAKRFVDRHRPARRNPSKKAAPSHDLFGEREHKLGLFGDKAYATLPAAKRAAAERKAKARPGQLGLELGGTRGLFD